MGVLATTSTISENTLNQGKSKSKIPDYARNYRNEYLFMRGIDKEFKYFLENINDATRGVFQNHRVDKIKKIY